MTMFLLYLKSMLAMNTEPTSVEISAERPEITEYLYFRIPTDPKYKVRT